jgi:adenylyltransferase/sulfurtransferase
MSNPFGAPEISVQEVEQKRQDGEEFIWLDVREPHELQVAYIDDERIVELPMSQLAARQLDALPEELEDKNAEVIVFCHKGTRSAQVTAWLRQQGWTNVSNMTGGIDAWAEEIDPDVGSY